MAADLSEIFSNSMSLNVKSESKKVIRKVGKKEPISIFLSTPRDKPGFFEVDDIQGVEGQTTFVIVDGLQDTNFLDIGSWIRKEELTKLKYKNRNLKFVVGEVV